MKISAINTFTNYSPANKNAGQRVNFGMFGTSDDARIVEYGGMPDHKPEIGTVIAKKIQPFIDEGFTKDYESRPGKSISPIDMLANSKHFLFYIRDDGLVGVKPIIETFEKESHEVRHDLGVRQRNNSTILSKFPKAGDGGRNTFNNMLSWIFKLQYKKNFPPTLEDIYAGCDPNHIEFFARIDELLKRQNVNV